MITVSAGNRLSVGVTEEMPPSDDELLSQRPAAAAHLASLERMVNDQELQLRERLARNDEAEQMEFDAAIAASSAIAASDAAERIVREVEESEKAEEEEPMISDTAEAAGPVQPLGNMPMDEDAVCALLRAQRGRGPAPYCNHARWRDPVRQAAVEALVARSQLPSDLRARDDGVAGDSETEPPPANGATHSAAYLMRLAGKLAVRSGAACARRDKHLGDAAGMGAAVERDQLDGSELPASSDVVSEEEDADVLTSRAAAIRTSFSARCAGRGRSRGRGCRCGIARPPVGGDASVLVDGAADRGR